MRVRAGSGPGVVWTPSGVPAERGRSRSPGSQSRRVINPAGACLAREDPPPWFGGRGTQGGDTRKRPWGYGADTRERADTAYPSRWGGATPPCPALIAGERPPAPAVPSHPRVCPQDAGVQGPGRACLFSSLLQEIAKERGLGGERWIALGRREGWETHREGLPTLNPDY